MTTRIRRFILLSLSLLLPGAMSSDLRAADAGAVLGDGQNALKTEYEVRAPIWTKLLNGDVADPANPQHQQAVDTAAKWATFRLTWGSEKDPAKIGDTLRISDVVREFGDNLQTIRGAREKGQKTGEMFIKQVIVHGLEVMQWRGPVARINGARLLARIPEQGVSESQAEVLARLAGTNQGDLADAYATIIKDPAQIDAARLYAFRGLRFLLALPPQTPPALPRDKEEAAVGAVVKFLQDRNKAPAPGTPQEEIDGYRYVRREAIQALAQCRYPTLADKTHTTWLLLKVAARDDIHPEPRIDERVEAAIGVTHALPDFDKDYQPDYAAHQLGLFVVDFGARYIQAKQLGAEDAALPWKVEASRLIEGLELMKAQSQKNAHVARVVDESLKLLTKIEKALQPNPSDLEQVLQTEASPSQQLYKGDANTVVKPANRKDAAEPVKPEEKKDK